MSSRWEVYKKWEAYLEKLKKSLSQDDFATWISPLIFRVEGDTFRIYAPNTFVLERLKQQYLREMVNYLSLKSIHLSVGEPKAGEIEMMGTPMSSPTSSPAPTFEKSAFGEAGRSLDSPVDINASYDSSKSNPSKPEFQKSTTERGARWTPSAQMGYLNPHFTFDTFVVGASNEVAFSAAKRVMEGGISMGNPLTIYGPSGLGKTHLLHAIANELRKKYQQSGFRYTLISSEFFFRNLINILQDKQNQQSLQDFKNYFNTLDLLMIDDVQLFAKKARTQDELFYVYNAIMSRGGQIILTADRYPREIEHLEERLRTRFSAGLPVMVGPPDTETRILILKDKAKQIHHTEMPDSCAEIIAQRIQSNVRELEAALNKVMAYVTLYRRSINEALIYEALREIFEQKAQQISIENIQKVVAEYYKLRMNDLLSKSRTRQVVLPRQVGMYLAKELTRFSLVEIGRAFGGRDHTTVLHAVQKIEKLRSDSEKGSVMESDYKSLYRRLTC